MEEIVTEELRQAGPVGREMIEGEEAVELAQSLDQQLELSEKARGKQPVPFNPRMPVPPELVPLGAMATEDARREGGWLGTAEFDYKSNLLAEALADSNVSPGPHTAGIMRQQREEAKRRWEEISARARGTVTHGMPEHRTVLTAAQPDAASFLSRDYHSAGRSRFLFSCADEYDGYAANQASGWMYSLPESAGGSSSNNNSN